MNLQQRIDLLGRLGDYLNERNEEWRGVVQKACDNNSWFTPEFVNLAASNVAKHFLDRDLLTKWAQHYRIDDNISKKNVGLVMAGNIPLVGFHDLVAIFISGHSQNIKLSSKDNLPAHMVNKIHEMDPATKDLVMISEKITGCDAYIATGSNNTSRYFEQYFAPYPHIIRKNKTSVAVLSNNDSESDLAKLSDDIHLFFGFGCRNVTKVYVPKDYDFIPLLNSFNRYSYFADFHKYRSNYDYQLSIMLMNNRFYMTNGSTLLIENPSVFSAISVVHYECYDDIEKLKGNLLRNEDIQCIAGLEIPFGQTQEPSLFTYADGVDTMQFLLTL